MQKFMGILIACLMLLGSAQAQVDENGLLPVEQAFKLSARIASPGRIALHWDIAPDYYLYRSRIKASSKETGATLGALQLPDGLKKHDEFLGDVEVYHGALDAELPYTLADAGATTLALSVSVQGCHETDPKICYPPHATKLTLDLPAASAPLSDAAPAPLFGGNAPAPGQSAFKLVGGSGLSASAAASNEPLPPEQAFVFEAIAASPTEILARWRMPPNYYLYRDKTELSVDDDRAVQLGAARWPTGTEHKDEHFGTVTVYFDEVELPIPLVRDSTEAQAVTLNAEYQGCQDNGICYPVMHTALRVELPPATAEQVAASQANRIKATSVAAKAPVAVAAATSQNAGEQSEDQRLMSRLAENWPLALLAFFGFGLLLSFTPCVFPMIPILSGIIAGAGNITTRRAFVLSVVYVLASSVVFTIAGVVAGLLGANLQAVFQKPWILVSFATIFVLLSLSMFGFYELQLPASWQNKLANVSNRQKSGSLLGVAVMGLLSALIVGPCVAPPLAAAVVYISQTRDPVLGGLALFALSLGMGAPLVVFGTAAGNLLPRAGAWMNAVKAVFGVSFLALAIWMLSRVLDPLWTMLMTGTLLVASGVYLGALERIGENASGWKRLWKACGVVVLILGATQLIGVAAGSRSLTAPLGGLAASGGSSEAAPTLAFRPVKSVDDLQREIQAANQDGKPVMLDFYADWCVSCKEMEAFTLNKPAVQRALAGFVLLKADVTANDEVDQALLKHFGLFGPPATIFFARDGQEQRALRLIGFEKSDPFAARIARVGS